MLFFFWVGAAATGGTTSRSGWQAFSGFIFRR